MATGTGNLPNDGMVFTPFDILTAEEQNQLVENIESLADGSGIGDGAITTNTLADSAVAESGLGYTKFHDGTLICRVRRFVVTRDGDGVTCSGTWTFPEPFINTDYSASLTYVPPTDSSDNISTNATPNASQLNSPAALSRTTTTLNMEARRIQGFTSFSSGDTMTIDAIVVGRWR